MELSRGGVRVVSLGEVEPFFPLFGLGPVPRRPGVQVVIQPFRFGHGPADGDAVEEDGEHFEDWYEPED